MPGPRVPFHTSILFSVCFLGVCAQVTADEHDFTPGEKLFALKVAPLLAEKCLACHGEDPDQIEGGLDLRSRESMLRGGDSFESDVVKLGDGKHSMLYLTTTRKEVGYEMPPKEADGLSEAEQWSIRDWIDAGADWPDAERVARIEDAYAEGEKVLVSKALSPQWQDRRYESEKLWAYRPIEKPTVPAGEHPIDFFIDRKLKTADLSPAPVASANTVVRRLSFNLTGLPPTPTQVQAFASEFSRSPHEAVQSMANELLASPHYGEHFGWRWLDVARYADTAGFANDYSRPNAWRYRDYVVRAFNDDKPYHQFVRQQIAGDELDETDVENLIATGFLRMGPWEQTSMSVFAETRGQWLDDVTDTVGQAFLAHSMLCCKCHDHKFDPVPTRDYYRMMSVFSTTQFAERKAPFLPEENLENFARSDDWIEKKNAAYRRQHDQLNRRMKANKTAETGDAKVGDNGLDPGDEASSARMQKNMKRHDIERDRTKPYALSVYTGKTIQRNNVAGRLDMPKDPWGKGKLDTDAIRDGGDVYAIGDAVVPGPLSAAVSLGGMGEPDFPGAQGKRRLALADWIVDPQNPLTPRVIVNRVWSWHFGRGIAGNPNNFGGTGGLPTHPELLDHLSTWFVENGGSIKALNRLIISSDLYLRGSVHPEPSEVSAKDPLGNLYASFPSRRLTAEELRDAMLKVSGEWNPAVGGIPCRPDINQEVAFQPRQIMGGTASVYEPDPLPSQRNRRTLYAERIRGLRDPFLEVFNQPGPDKSCELRETSTVAPQALTLLNSQEVFDRAVALANRLLVESHADREAMISRLFRLTLAREPSPDETRACLDHWQTADEPLTEISTGEEPIRSQIERTVMAEKTGQPYTFIEIMPAYENYEPDLALSSLPPSSRGLAHVCRVLLNTNEFAYVD